tara:strand:+ start:2249 stop:2431 length:183 start_codon:yes stop_codon:yes gene_type:complete
MHIPRVQAKREILARNIEGKLTGEYVYNLILMATEDEDLAGKAQTNYYMNEMRAGRTPEV